MKAPLIITPFSGVADWGEFNWSIVSDVASSTCESFTFNNIHLKAICPDDDDDYDDDDDDDDDVDDDDDDDENNLFNIILQLQIIN